MKTTRCFLLSAVLGGITAVVLSCADSAPLGVGARGLLLPPLPPPIDTLISRIQTQAQGLLKCSALPYDSVEQTIGPEGGVLRVGPHMLFVPEGSLQHPVTITAVVPSDTVNQVRFHPEGLVFAVGANVTLNYSNCDLSGVLGPVRVAHTTEDLHIIEYLVSQDCPEFQESTGRIEHFSTYAVAW